MQKASFIAGIIISTAIICMAGCVRTTSTPASQEIAATFTTKLISIEANDYRVSIKYPYTNSAKINGIFDKLIKDQEAMFKKDCIFPKPNPDWRYELWITYASSVFTKDITCFKFEAYEFAGGAHGSTRVITKVLNMKSGAEYRLGDVLSGDHPKQLSAIIVPMLAKRFGKQADLKWINEGAGPKADNFKRFTLTPKTITIYFEQYAVAPYSFGVQEVSIPLKEISGLLKEPFKEENK